MRKCCAKWVVSLQIMETIWCTNGKKSQWPLALWLIKHDAFHLSKKKKRIFKVVPVTSLTGRKIDLTPFIEIRREVHFYSIRITELLPAFDFRFSWCEIVCHKRILERNKGELSYVHTSKLKPIYIMHINFSFLDITRWNDNGDCF